MSLALAELAERETSKILSLASNPSLARGVTTTNHKINGGSKIIVAGGLSLLTVEMICAVGSKHKASEMVFLL